MFFGFVVCSSAAICIGISFVMLVLIQLFAGLVVWFSILFVLFSLAGATAYLWWNYYLVRLTARFASSPSD